MLPPDQPLQPSPTDHPPGWLQRFWQPETGIFLVIWFVLMVGGSSKLLRDPGTFWHIVVGKRIVEHGDFITKDPFSFTRAGERWVAWQWGGDVVMAVLHNIGGFDSVLVGGVTLLAGLYTWLGHRLMAAGMHWLYASVVVAAAVGVSAHNFHLRPHLATMILFGLTYATLVDFEAGRVGIRRLYWLVPLFVVWANTHGGFLGGFATCGMAFVGWGVYYFWGKPPIQDVRTLWILAGLVVVLALTALVNPFGWEIPRIWFRIMFGLDLTSYIEEHARLNPMEPKGFVTLAAGVAYLVALAGTWRRPRITWLLPLVWLVLSISRVRHGPLFIPAATLALADMLPYITFGRRQPILALEPVRQSIGWTPFFLPALLVTLSLILHAAQVKVPIIGYGWARHDPANWPTDMVQPLQTLEQSVPDGTPIYCEYLDGSFIMYYAPRLRVYNDDRCELYGDKWQIEQLRLISEIPQEIEQRADETGFRYALVRHGTPLHNYMESSPRWKVVAPGRNATIYVRQP